MEWTAEEIKFLLEHYESHGMNYCAEHLGRTRPAIRHKASRLGIKRRGKGREDRIVDKSGYIALSSYKKRKVVHRIVMENHLGRELSPDELVHHKDGNKHNNHISNLEVVTRSEHMKIHNETRNRDEKGRFTS